METSMIIAILALGTIAAGLIFALVSKKKIDDRLEGDSPKSTLAADKASDGKPVDV